MPLLVVILAALLQIIAVPASGDEAGHAAFVTAEMPASTDTLLAFVHPPAAPGSAAGAHGTPAGAPAKEPGEAVLPEAYRQAPAVDLSTIKTLEEVVAAVAPKKIVYVGESHDQFSHHAVELEIIKSLHERGVPVAIGMEMFQRPFQKALDDHIAGRTTEKEFLRSSEYFKRWGFDYHLYKPILDYAREEKIPVIALNLRREIINKVSEGGIDGLTEEERRSIPEDLDFSDEEYKKRLKEFYEDHPSSKGGQFEYFYQAQILWDETMAQSVTDFFMENETFLKEGRMVVLAGSGHLLYGSGIPKRAHRRNGLDYAIVLNQVPVSKGVADYIVYPKPVEGPSSPKLMVILKQEGGALTITGLPEGSVSAKAGLEVGDRILSLDNEPVPDIDDVRLHLFFKKKGDTVKVKVMRRVFLFGGREKTFDVVL